MAACCFDNRSRYIAGQLKPPLGKRGIRVVQAKPRSGKSKGKMEKLHQVVDAFMREAKLNPVDSLEERNRRWKICPEECYAKKPHEGSRETTLLFWGFPSFRCGWLVRQLLSKILIPNLFIFSKSASSACQKKGGATIRRSSFALRKFYK